MAFCFGIGVILAVKTVNSLECCIEELIRLSQIKWQKKLKCNK